MDGHLLAGERDAYPYGDRIVMVTIEMNKKRPSRDYRRTVVLVASIALLAGYGYGLTVDQASGYKLASEMMGRIGLMFGALWLAWDSLRRPAQWLPPGMAMVCVIALAVLAARPRLIVVVIPAVGVLLAMSVLVKAFRGTK